MVRQTPRKELPLVMGGAIGIERFGAEAGIDSRIIEEQALRLGVVDHPPQGDVGELSLGVTSSHIAMHAREPYLLHFIVVGSRSSIRIRPQRGEKGGRSE